MRSIRHRLVATLVAGILGFSGVLLLIFYYYAEALLRRHFDESLSYKLRTFVEMTELEDDGFEFDFERLRLPEFEPAHGEPEYYQVWSQTGEILARSPSMGTGQLPRPPVASHEPSFFEVQLPNGKPGRAVSRRFVPRIDSKRAKNARLALAGVEIDLAIARSREPLDEAKAILLRSFAVFGLALPLGTVLIVRWAIGSGLVALNRLSREISMLNTDNLQHRFETRSMPEELLPISERLNELLGRLRKAFDRERRFTADIAHELRTPLSELRVLAEVGLTQGEEDESVRAHQEYLRDVLEVSEQMARLVTTLLAISRSEMGHQSVAREPVDLVRLLELTWRSQQEEARKKAFVWKLEVPDTAWVASDAGLLGAILANLLSNVVTYTPLGGRVHCLVETRGERVRLEVGNTTDDLQPADVERLFEPFWRKEESRTQAEHHGLGLSIVETYAKLLGLEIAATLPRPDWLVVSLTLPCWIEEEKESLTADYAVPERP